MNHFTLIHVKSYEFILYKFRDNKEEKPFDALEWLAAMPSHVPDRREQIVRYYAWDSNVSQGK